MKAKPCKPDKLALYHTEQAWMRRFRLKTGLNAESNFRTYTEWKRKQMAKPKGKKR